MKASSKRRQTRSRTFTGCWTCRHRKVKCDQKTPACTPCIRLGRACGGYGVKLIWHGDEEGNDEPPDFKHRRILSNAWMGYSILNSDVVDVMIADLDGDGLSFGFSTIRHHHIPFSTFAVERRYATFAGELPVGVAEVVEPLNIQPILTNGNSYQEKMLFHHYIAHVAQIMMPFEDKRNPWLSDYPAVASACSSYQQQALYHALLTHAAFSLTHLLGKDAAAETLAAKHYQLAISHVHSCFEAKVDSNGCLQAAIMTLMMAEIYSGRTARWRTHLRGASALLHNDQRYECSTLSHFEWSTKQSLFIIQAIAGTNLVEPVESYGTSMINDESHAITARPTVGFTIGATKSVLKAINDITGLVANVASGEQLDLPAVALICRALEECRHLCVAGTAWQAGDLLPNYDEETLYRCPVVQCHLQAFIAAAYLYMHQVLFHATPRQMKVYVREVFDNVQKYFEMKGGNITVWPVFLAAVEACDNQDVTAAQAWLLEATQVGMGNRKQAEIVIKEVWRRRQAIACETGIALPDIRVDWREAMRDLDIDILLV